MLRHWVVMLAAIAFLLAAATAAGQTEASVERPKKQMPIDRTPYIRKLQNGSIGLFNAATVCVVSDEGKSFKTEGMTLLVVWLSNLIGLFSGTQVVASGLSCEELCPCSNNGICSRITNADYNCDCNEGYEFDGTTCSAKSMICGGSGIECPSGTTCADGGICVPLDSPGCGGIAGITCPDGLICVDDPNDSCFPENGGADCIGICESPPPQDITVTFVDANANNIFAEAGRTGLSQVDTPMGIWSWAAYRPHKANKSIYPGLRGGPILLHWSDLEGTQGVFDWSQVESYMDAAVGEGLYYSLEILVGPSAPEWLYEQGVPKVFTTNEGWQFPYYFDPLYLESFDKLTEEAVSYLKMLPDEKAKALHAVILNDGSTGDPYCYKGDPVDSQYDISKEEWDIFRQDHFQAVHDYLGPDGLDSVELAFTHVSAETEVFLRSLFPNVSAFKNGMASHGYHIPEDESVIDHQRSQAFDGDPALDGNHVQWFGEMDREWLNGWFQQAPVESFWWSSIYALHMGLSRWHVRDDALEVAEYHFAFDFFNKHAPHIDAASSPYAFCALREGIDAGDTTKFSESEYGIAKDERVLNILDEYKSFGAQVEDETVTGYGPMQFRQRSSYVDVMYGGVTGNYHRFLHQIDPSAESIGWWHVGSKAWPYGRFARSFQASSGKNAMYFQLDDHFISNKSVRHAVKVSITYFDGGNGMWELLYNDPVAGMQSAVSVACYNTQNWKKAQIEIYDAVLNGGLGKGADFILQHITGSDTKFHMIELDLLE